MLQLNNKLLKCGKEKEHSFVLEVKFLLFRGYCNMTMCKDLLSIVMDIYFRKYYVTYYSSTYVRVPH